MVEKENKKPEFKERVAKGNIGEEIFRLALEKQIIPNKGGILRFIVIEGDDESRQYNLVNGDFRFLGLNLAEFKVDVKCGDEITQHCLDNIDNGTWIFLNAFPTLKTTGLPFMFRLDDKVKNWIRTNAPKRFEIDVQAGREILWYRILKHMIEPHLPKDSVYEFDEKAFCKHRTEYLVKIGELNP